MSVRTGILAIAAMVTALGTAVAAEPVKVAALGDVSGKVMVNQGRGFVAAKPGMEIRAGDRIVTLDGASAKLVYGDGCLADLKENNLLSVDGKCATKPMSPRSESIKLAQAIGSDKGVPRTGVDVPTAPVGAGAGAGGVAASAAILPAVLGLGLVVTAGADSHNQANNNNDNGGTSPQ